jgi:hypothetical protein
VGLVCNGRFGGGADSAAINMITNPFAVYRAVKFLFVGPVILVFLAVVNLMTSPGHWWIQWPALGLGIAWVCCLLRVLKAVVMMGGLAALVSWVVKGRRG